MTKQEVADRIVEIGIVPVVRASSPKQAAQAAAAVCAGGIPIVEITMTVPGAIEVIAQLATTAGSQVLIGAGTVLDAETAQRCLDAGAQFLVSPGFDPDTVKLANRLGKLIMAGALTPTEVIAAWKAGSDFVKSFPVVRWAVPTTSGLEGAFAASPMVPTGGINLNTAADFIRAGSAALGIGGELVSASALESGNASAITQAAQSYVAIVRDARRATKT